MNKQGILRKFMLMMGVLIVCVVLLWVAFFLLTRNALAKNTVLQVEATSDTIIRSIEQELLSLEDTADALSRYDRVSKMIHSEDVISFYDAGKTAAERSDSIIGSYCPADNVIVYDRDGLFYRLKGEMANTALKRAFYLINGSRKKTLTLTSNDMTYIGCSAPVIEEGGIIGYVVLMMERTRLEALLNSFKDLDYLGAVVMAEGKAICKSSGLSEVIGSVENVSDISEAKNSPLLKGGFASEIDGSYSSELKALNREEELQKVLADSAFYKEKEIGLSGFNLLIYCENTLVSRLEAYFRIAMPVTIGILFGILSIFVFYWNRHIVDPINSIINNINKTDDRPLPLTGEAYFDDLVDHINDNLKSIAERDKELYDSGIRIKEYELERERTLVALLKKQISAHFTVNTLNAVRALINKGKKEEAARICDELSALLRYANAGEEYISLLEEFYILNQYASIMQTRYPGRFSFEAEEDDSLADIYIPRMLLQPLVENAILHGFESGMETIRIYAEIADDVTVFVKDNGRGIEEQELKELTEMLTNADALMETSLHHVALLNIQKRIRMVCGADYGISIESKEDIGTTVSLHLPLLEDSERVNGDGSL